jgi:hypothetical protein
MAEGPGGGHLISYAYVVPWPPNEYGCPWEGGGDGMACTDAMRQLRTISEYKFHLACPLALAFLTRACSALPRNGKRRFRDHDEAVGIGIINFRTRDGHG